MQIDKGLYKLLLLPVVYSFFRRFISSKSKLDSFVNGYVSPFEKCKILDIGCGPAKILEYYPKNIEYVGIDINENYIKNARDTYGGDKRTFLCGTVDDINNQEFSQFDIITCLGVLHHLDDNQIKQLVKNFSKLLKPTGHIVTLDNCYVNGQNPISKFLIAHDRGKNVRTPEEYDTFFNPYFAVKGTKCNLCRIPYDHYIIVAKHKNA